MKRLILCGLALMTFAAPVASVAGERTPYAACVIEARKAITDTPAYRNASVRQKQVLLNAYAPELSRKAALCAAKKSA